VRAVQSSSKTRSRSQPPAPEPMDVDNSDQAMDSDDDDGGYLSSYSKPSTSKSRVESRTKQGHRSRPDKLMSHSEAETIDIDHVVGDSTEDESNSMAVRRGTSYSPPD
jgi:hypothetical protein